MNNIIEKVWKQQGLTPIEFLPGNAFTAEAGAHTFIITGIDENGAEVALSGTPTASFIRSDGTTVAISSGATLTGGKVHVTLSEECYGVTGRFALTVFLTSNGQKVAIYACVGNVARSNTSAISPGVTADVVDLVNRIDTATASIPASYTALLAAIATDYSSSNTYNAGDFVWYSGLLYRANQDIATAESWTAAHWTQVVLADSLNNELSSLKSTFDSVVTIEPGTETKTINQASPELTLYGNGAVSATNGRYVSDTTHDTFLWTPTFNTSLYIIRNTANFLRIIEYNKTLTTLPSSSQNSDFVRGAAYESTNELPTESNPWIVPAGHTIAISRANNSNYVTQFTLYYQYPIVKKSLADDVAISSGSIVENDVFKTLQNDYYIGNGLEWKHANKSGVKIAITENNPINLVFNSEKLSSISSANLFDIVGKTIEKNSSQSDATVTKTETGVKIVSNDTGGSNRFVYFNYTAVMTGKLWISAYAKCSAYKKNDCSLAVQVNGVDVAPKCIGEGLLKRYVDVTEGDSVQVRLWYHLYTSTNTNTVEYSNIMLSYSDADYSPYIAPSASNPISKGSVLSFTESTTVEYDYTGYKKPLKVVCFGDSITGMFDYGADYCTMLTNMIPCECVNVGFSGSTWADHPSTHYVPFSLNRLIEAIASNDFSYQDAHIESISSDFYAKHLANLKAVDFSKVDVVTFLAGTNDWAFNIPLLSTDTPATEQKQRYDIEDAVKYCISELLTAYPNLVIFVITPYWRANNVVQANDSDYTPNSNGVYLYQVSTTISECSAKNNTQCENLYHNLGANWKTRLYWTIDGTHPTTRTKEAIAQRIKRMIAESGLV